MTTGQANPKVDAFFAKARTWRDEFLALRAVALACPLAEELKWRWPCYAFDGRNIVLMHGFKDYCALLFFKGALLEDPHGLLIRQTENVQSGRQIRFRNVREILDIEAMVKAYIIQAIEIEKSGLKAPRKTTADFGVPEEFQVRLEASPELKAAFEALTPGRQRAYLFYFAAPKQSKTRESRIEKSIPQILEGKGLMD